MSAVIQTSAASIAAAMAVGPAERLLAFDGNRSVSVATFEAEVRALAALLPEGTHAVNLCEDRYRFLVAFCAVALRRQVTLLPSSRAPAVVLQVLASHPGAYCLGDGTLDPAPPGYWTLPAVLPACDGPPPAFDDTALVAIGYTSGSTGAPTANPKTWGSFRTSSAQNLAALADLWAGAAQPHVVATVPAQHMYGMEMSVVLPLLGPAAVHMARPFFPGDVATALHAAPAPRLLVTTPVHLRALVESGVALPPLAGIVSATAPLAAELACAAETRFACEVREVFGSTETCVFAVRRTARDARWTPLPGVRVVPLQDGTLVSAPHLPQPVALADLVDVDGDGHFLVHGRQADLLEIAGKRASLGDLTRRLNAIPGVRDGVMVQMAPGDAGGIGRIAAIVVAPGVGEATLVAALRDGLDPVFLPRRVLFVEALPRGETGKLPRAVLLALLER